MFMRTGMLLMLVLFFARMLQAQPEPVTTVGGYGELHYNEPDGARHGQLDFHRFVIYLAHTFNDNIAFRSELELEHTRLEAGEERGGEVALEQAYIEYRFSPAFGIRTGIVVVPIGIINQFHEPPTFHGVERPNVDRVIIPTTWSEAGAGVVGSPAEGVSYQLFVVAGLNASGFDAASGLRGGRQEAFESNPANPSITGRLDYRPFPALAFGGAFFFGNSAADEDSIGNAPVTLWEADARLTIADFSLRAVGAVGTIGDTGPINARFNSGTPSKLYGGYIEAAYNILPLLAPDSEADLSFFARYEKYNTQASTEGFQAMEQYDRNDVVVGTTYLPVPNVAFKMDYTFMNNALNTGIFTNARQLNLGVGYYF